MDTPTSLTFYRLRISTGIPTRYLFSARRLLRRRADYSGTITPGISSGLSGSPRSTMQATGFPLRAHPLFFSTTGAFHLTRHDPGFMVCRPVPAAADELHLFARRTSDPPHRRLGEEKVTLRHDFRSWTIHAGGLFLRVAISPARIPQASLRTGIRALTEMRRLPCACSSLKMIPTSIASSPRR
jgi:hypothetical protein